LRTRRSFTLVGVEHRRGGADHPRRGLGLPVATGADTSGDDGRVGERFGEFDDIVLGGLVEGLLVVLVEPVGDVGDDREIVLDGDLRERM